MPAGIHFVIKPKIWSFFVAILQRPTKKRTQILFHLTSAKTTTATTSRNDPTLALSKIKIWLQQASYFINKVF